MNKHFVLFLVLVAALIYYYKTQQPQVNREPVQPVAVEKTDVVGENTQQSQLPNEAKGMIAEIKSSDEDDKFPVDPLDEKREKDRDEIERHHQKETRMNQFGKINPASEIPMIKGTSNRSMQWPCTKATFSEITDSYNIVWGPNSPDPHDKSWYFAIAHGITEYMICRSASLTNDSGAVTSDICLGMELFKDYRDAQDIFRVCKDNMYLFNVYLYAAGKGSKEECNKFPIRLKDVDVCYEVKKHRGKTLCDSLNLKKGTESYIGCMKYFPESESDCSALRGPDADTCRSNLSLFNALKSNDPKLCPAGKVGIACLSYFSRSTQDPCAKYMNKLSTDFCSGGKYAKTRKVDLSGGVLVDGTNVKQPLPSGDFNNSNGGNNGNSHNNSSLKDRK